MKSTSLNPEDKNLKNVSPFHALGNISQSSIRDQGLESISITSSLINKILNQMFRVLYSKSIDMKVLPFAITNVLEFPIAYASFHFLNHENLEDEYIDVNCHRWSKNLEPVDLIRSP